MTDRRAKVIAVVGARGGTGTTTVATNIAVALANYSQAKTAFLDLNVGRTIVDQLLDLQGDGVGTLVDLLPILAELGGEPATADVLAQVQARHASGLSVIAASRDSEPVHVPADAVTQLIGGLAQTADVVVCDLPSTYDEATFAAIAAADRTLIVATPEVPTLKRSKALLQRLRAGTEDGSAWRIVLNRANDGGELSLPQMEDFLGEPAWSVLPAAAPEARKFHDRRVVPVLDLSGPLGKALYLAAFKLHPLKRLVKAKK